MRDFTLPRLLIAIVDVIFGLAVLGLGLRFILRLLGANPAAGFVDFVYRSTNPLLDPFRDIFTPYVVEPGSVVEFSTLVAIVAYLIIAWLMTELISYIAYNAKQTYRRRI